MLVPLPHAPTDTTPMPHTRAHLTATMALAGSPEASFSAPARGSAATADVAFTGAATTVAEASLAADQWLPGAVASSDVVQ